MSDKEKARKPWYKRFWVWVAAVVLIIGFTNAADGEQDNASTDKPKTEKVSDSKTKKKSETETPKVPHEYKNALDSAESYSENMHMSKKDIYDQLKSKHGDQFSEEASRYAVNNLKNVDWNKNALESAKSYDEYMKMSPKAIKDQLTSPHGGQFTEQQANYAVANLPK